MQRTALAFVLSAAFAAPVALAQTADPAMNAPAGQAAPATTNAAGTPAANQAANQAGEWSAEERQQATTRLGVGSDSPDRDAAQKRQVAVSDLNGMDVYNTQGEEIGSVSDVVADASDSHFIVIGQGGFFGIGEDRAALPLDRFWIQDDRLVVAGVTEDDIGNLGDVRTGDDEAYSSVDNDTQAEVAVWEGELPDAA